MQKLLPELSPQSSWISSWFLNLLPRRVLQLIGFTSVEPFILSESEQKELLPYVPQVSQPPKLFKARHEWKGTGPELVENLQSKINQLLKNTRSRPLRGIDQLAAEFVAAAGDVFEHDESKLGVTFAMLGDETHQQGLIWHIDAGPRSPKARLVYPWQGPGTVYCETGGRHPSREYLLHKKEEYSNATILGTHLGTYKLMSLNFSHPIIWGHVRTFVGKMLRINGISIYDYLSQLSQGASHDVRQALETYEKHLYYNAVTLSIATFEKLNDRLANALRYLKINNLCTDLGGTVYVTPPGYMSMHAACYYPSHSALHRRPVPTYERDGAFSRFLAIY